MRRNNNNNNNQVVILNVYDLIQHNEYLYDWGLGTYHSGVEFDGREYTFASGSGVFNHEPKQVPGMAKYRESIELGSFQGTTKDFERILDDLKSKFPGNSYNILTQNCNHFANALVTKLLNKPIPGYVNRLANLGSMVSCLLPPQLLNDAPVNQQGSGNNRMDSLSSSGYQVIVPRGRESSIKSNTTTTSTTISSSSSSSSISNSGSNNSSGFILGGDSSVTNTSQLGIHERREKARLAALKRLSKQES